MRLRALVLAFGAVVSAAGSSVVRIVPNVAAIAGQPMTLLPAPPAWLANQASAWTIGDVTAELKKATDKPPQINNMRQTFVRPDHRWLLAFVRWFGSLDKPLNIHYEDELWNCANYARCFVAFADLLAQKGGETRGSICVGWATVYNRESFANAPAGMTHAVVIVGTSEGLFVVEPQNGTMVALDNYPNRDEFVELNF